MTNWVAIAKCLFQGQPKSLELRERSWGNEVAAHLVARKTSKTRCARRTTKWDCRTGAMRVALANVQVRHLAAAAFCYGNGAEIMSAFSTFLYGLSGCEQA
jgi:hypothetical protein